MVLREMRNRSAMTSAEFRELAKEARNEHQEVRTSGAVSEMMSGLVRGVRA